MNEAALRDLLEAATAGRVSRRVAVARLAGLGLAAPFAHLLLARSGLAQTAAPIEYKPTRAGGGGALKTLFWQGPTLLNPHFAVGAKDAEGCRVFYEPLAAWGPDGNLVPAILDSVRAKATLGEISDALRAVFGTYKPRQEV